MASKFGQGVVAGVGIRQQQFEQEAKAKEVKAAKDKAITDQADAGIKAVLEQAAALSNEYAERGGDPTKYQQLVRSMIKQAKTTATMAAQNGYGISYSPELIEAIEGKLLATPNPSQIATTQGEAKGKGLVSEASAVSTEGNVPLEQAQIARGLRPKPEAGTTVNVDVSGNSFFKELGKEGAKDIFERRKLAVDAAQSLSAIGEARILLDKGIVSGAFADWRVGLGKTIRLFGIDLAKDDVDNAQAFGAAQAKQVASIIKAFGAGTGLSDADREFATKAAAGDINMTEEAIRKILDINERANINIINSHNKSVKKIPEDQLPFSLTVEIPRGRNQPKFLGFEE